MAEIVVHVEKIRGVPARYRLILVRTGQRELVENGLIPTEETVVLHLDSVIH